MNGTSRHWSKGWRAGPGNPERIRLTLYFRMSRAIGCLVAAIDAFGKPLHPQQRTFDSVDAPT